MKKAIRVIAAALAAAVFCLNLYVELSPRYAPGPEWKMGFAITISLLLGAAFFFGVPPGARQKKRHDYVTLLFWYYLWMLVNVLFFDSVFGRSFSGGYNPAMVNLEPLRTVRNYLAAYHYGNISLRLTVLNLLGNLVAFAPMGFFLPALFRWQRSIFFFTASLALTVSAVEVAQVLSGAGSCDVDDFILNLAGALLVYIVCRISPLWRRVCRVTPKKEEEHD